MDTMAHAAHGDDNGHAIPHGWRRYVYSCLLYTSGPKMVKMPRPFALPFGQSIRRLEGSDVINPVFR